MIDDDSVGSEDLEGVFESAGVAGFRTGDANSQDVEDAQHSSSTDGDRQQRGDGVASAFAVTIAASFGTILLSLVSGVLTARLLGPEGRGQVAGIQSWILTIAWLPAMGFGQAMVYFQSKGEAPPARVLSTTLVAIPVLGAVGVAIGQLALPLGFSAQTSETLNLARIFLCTVPFILGTEAGWAVLMANKRFAFLGIIRLLQPFLYVAILLFLWVFDDFTPFSVLAAQAASYALTLAVAFIRLGYVVGLTKPKWSLARSGFSYGLRLQGVTLGSLVASRLDVMLLPAFVGATDLGYYAIAVNVASMVMTLFGSLQMVVFPVASGKEGGASIAIVERGVRLSLLGSAACVVVLAITAPWLISLVYGADFVASVGPMQLLLPGLVLWSATSVLAAGLQAVGRPGSASIAQLGGLVITVVGLAVSLTPFGIYGAAATSSVAYTVSFVFSWIALHRASSFRLSSALAPAYIRSDARYVRKQVRDVLARGRSQEGRDEAR